jgi:nucleoside-diphosphate-sugar epimerase
MAEKSDDAPLVTVTGASGFIAMHCIVKLLEEGKRVRGTLRTPSRAQGIREAMKRALGTDPGEALSFVQADLLRDEGWADAMRGAEGLLHVASPLPRQPPKHEDDLITPARDGALRALRSATQAGVRSIVMTSSIASVGYGHPRDPERVFTEADWTNPEGGVSAYEKSKTLAERAAWEFIESLGPAERPRFATLLPGLVLGPVLDADYGTSGELIRKLMLRDIPGCPDLGLIAVDARDIASAHLLALSKPEANGKRFILGTPARTLEIVRVLDRAFSPRGYKIPRLRLPDFAIRLVAIFDRTARLAIPELGPQRRYSCARAEQVLGWKGRSLEEMTVAMGESMIEFGVV